MSRRIEQGVKADFARNKKEAAQRVVAIFELLPRLFELLKKTFGMA
jgi:hypothetical protein